MYVAVGGHYVAGERIEDGVREIKEEIGIDVPFKKLQSSGIRQTVATLAPDYINREFQHIFLLVDNRSLIDYPLISSEVSGLVEVPIDKGIKLLQHQLDSLKVTGIFRSGDSNKLINTKLTLQDFVPSYLKINQFMLRLFIAAKRYIGEKEMDLLFW